MSASVNGRRTARRLASIVGTVGLLAGMLAATSGTAAAATAAPRLDCSGGSFATFTPELIHSGTYSSITVSGFCEVESGAKITVLDGLTVAPGGFLVAAGALDNNGSGPDCNRTITVSGGIKIGAFGSLVLGDGPGSGCATNTSTTVNNGLWASGPLDLIVHGTVVNGGFTSLGGGDGLPCNFQGFPTYSTLEDSRVNGPVTVSGYHACWLGFARNHINGGVTLRNNALDDPDAMEILANSINGGLACSGNTAGGSPRATDYADGPNGPVQEPNTIRGAATGQCAGL